MTQIKMKIKKGDTVIVNTGKDKGKKGEVLKTLISKSRVIVKGVNVVKKHTKPTQISAGGIIEKELSIHVSNVALADPKDDKPTRVGYKTLESGKKIRVAKRSGETIDS
jgi:large subunit ribosomal protein L24